MTDQKRKDQLIEFTLIVAISACLAYIGILLVVNTL